MTVASELGGVLERWRLEPIESTERATSGTMNDTFILTTTQRQIVLRRHRRPERWRVDLEHAVIAHARRKGVPIPPAIPTPQGELVVESDGAFYSLFTFARGDQVARAQLTPGQAWSMGRTLASIHLALADFPAPVQKSPDQTVDLGQVTATLRSLLQRIDRLPARTDQDGWARDHLAGKLRWLETAPHMSRRLVPADALQLGHGDFQETNLFFVGDRVVDVIDWDKSEPGWPPTEIVRCLDLSLGLAPVLCGAMVRGYRSVHHVGLDELDLAAANYGFDRAHSQWLYENIYLHGNDRLRRFLEPGPFVPFADRWSALRSRSGEHRWPLSG